MLFNLNIFYRQRLIHFMSIIQSNLFVRKTNLGTVIGRIKYYDLVQALPYNEDYKQKFLKAIAKLEILLLKRTQEDEIRLETQELEACRALQECLQNDVITSCLKQTKNIDDEIIRLVETLGISLSVLYPAVNDEDSITLEPLDDLLPQHRIKLFCGKHADIYSLGIAYFDTRRRIQLSKEKVRDYQDILKMKRRQREEIEHELGNFQLTNTSEYQDLCEELIQKREDITTSKAQLEAAKSYVASNPNEDLPCDSVIQGCYTPRDVLALIATNYTLCKEWKCSKTLQKIKELDPDEYEDEYEYAYEVNKLKEKLNPREQLFFELQNFHFKGSLRALSTKKTPTKTILNKILFFHRVLERNMDISLSDIVKHSKAELETLVVRKEIDLNMVPEGIMSLHDYEQLTNDGIQRFNNQAERYQHYCNSYPELSKLLEEHREDILRNLVFISFDNIRHNMKSVVLNQLVEQGVMAPSQRFSLHKSTQETVETNYHYFDAWSNLLYENVSVSIQNGDEDGTSMYLYCCPVIELCKNLCLNQNAAKILDWDAMEKEFIDCVYNNQGDLEQFKRHFRKILLSRLYEEGLLTTQINFIEVEPRHDQNYAYASQSSGNPTDLHSNSTHTAYNYWRNSDTHFQYGDAYSTDTDSDFSFEDSNFNSTSYQTLNRLPYRSSRR